MITFAELIENGFVKDFEWNNRYYFTKNGFDIVEHFGVSRYDDHNRSGYGKKFETIEELNEAYREWAETRIKKYEEYGEQIRILKESLK
jgi:predicted methyltransferase